MAAWVVAQGITALFPLGVFEVQAQPSYTLRQDETEKSSRTISLLLKRTQGCAGCQKIRNIMLKMGLVVCSANIDSTSNELQKNLKMASKRPIFWADFPISLKYSWILALQTIIFFSRKNFLICWHPTNFRIWFSSGWPWMVFGSFLSVCMYDSCLAPLPKNTFYNVESGPLYLGSKQVKCPNTPLEERVLLIPMGFGKFKGGIHKVRKISPWKRPHFKGNFQNFYSLRSKFVLRIQK